MFVDKEVRPQGETVKPRVMKMSEAIRKGATVVKEDLGWKGCAVGTALAGVKLDARDTLDPQTLASAVFNVPWRVVSSISRRHWSQEIDRMQAADILEKQGY